MSKSSLKPMNNHKVTFFTIVARNYLAYAYVLGDSVKKYHPDCDFFIFIMDDIQHEYQSEIASKGFLSIYPHQISLDPYEHFVFKYDIVEACTGVKPFVIQHLVEIGSEKVIYLDPDILCFRRLDEAIEALDTHSIVITPHSLSPIDLDYFHSDELLLSYGVYNLGFLGVSRGEVTDKFLAWWANRLFDRCIKEKSINLFVDQKWMDLIISYFDSVFILRKKTYNIAYWNLHERNLQKINDKFCLKDTEEPIAFIHYSSFPLKNLNQISKNLPSPDHHADIKKKIYSLDSRPDLLEPWNLYKHLLISQNHNKYSSINYAYASYSNGETISHLERVLFLKSKFWKKQTTNPFEIDNDSFFEFCRKLGIKSQKPAPINLEVSLTIQKKFKRFINIFHFFMHLLIRIIGVDTYTFLVYYISKQLLIINHGFLLKNHDELER
jgi:hypothetical protein